MSTPTQTLTGSPARSDWFVLVCVAGFLVLAPNIEFRDALSPYDQKRLLQFALFAVAGTLLLGAPALRRSWLAAFLALPAVTRLLLAAVAAGGLLSSMLAASPRYALAEVGLFASLFGVLIALAASIARLGADATRFLLLTLTFSAGLYLVRFFAGYASALALDLPIFIPELYSNFSHVRFFSQMQSWTLPLIVLPALLAGHRARRLALLALATGWWMLHFGTGTRGTSIGLLAAAIVVAVVFGRRALRWLATQAGCAAVGGLLYYLLLGLPETMGNITGAERLVSTGASNRPALFADALRMVYEHPLLGAGPMHYAFSFEHFTAHPHSAPLQWAAEWGPASALVMLALLGWAMLAWLRARRAAARAQSRDENLLDVALTGSAVTAAVHALVSGIIVMPLSQVWMTLVGAWMLARHRAPAAARHDGRAAGPALVIGVLVTFGLWAPVVALDGPRLVQRVESYKALALRTLRPRLWQQGYIGDIGPVAPDPASTPSPAEQDSDDNATPPGELEQPGH